MRTLKFLQKHLMTATSYMIPFVVAGGDIVCAIRYVERTSCRS